MGNEGIIKQDLQIQNLLSGFLRASKNNSELSKESHLDEDSLTAFVEGNLNFRESQPIVNHLVKCSFCRHVTTELVKLDYAFADVQTAPTVDKNSEPASISNVLSGLLSRIFGTNDGAVFAHHQSEEEEKAEDPKRED